jgi:glycosyltransferase involved in cell wall biosynthesis
MSVQIEIALATFQGGRYLAEQLASLSRQTTPFLRLIVRDDGSSDGTVDMLCQSGAKGMEMTMLPNDGLRLGPSQNFSTILAATRAPHVALCDQDDLWSGTKLERLHAAMCAAEAAAPQGMPILVCSDLRLIDGRGHLLAPSYWRRQRYDPVRGSAFGSLLVMNCFPGCSMMVNRALLDRALPIPPGVVMHDWWLALVAGAAGSLITIREPQVDYRIHAQNAVGLPVRSIPGWLRSLASTEGVRSAMSAAILQARALEARLADQPDSPKLDLLRTFCAIEGQGWIARRWTLVRNHIGKHGNLRQVNLLMRV